MSENAETLTTAEWDEIKKLTNDIMDIVTEIGVFLFSDTGREDARLKVQQYLADKCLAELRAYNERLAAEGIHSPARETGLIPHPIANCVPEVCGRYPGQRRDRAPDPGAGPFSHGYGNPAY